MNSIQGAGAYLGKSKAGGRLGRAWRIEATTVSAGSAGAGTLSEKARGGKKGYGRWLSQRQGRCDGRGAFQTHTLVDNRGKALYFGSWLLAPGLPFLPKRKLDDGENPSGKSTGLTYISKDAYIPIPTRSRCQHRHRRNAKQLAPRFLTLPVAV